MDNGDAGSLVFPEPQCRWRADLRRSLLSAGFGVLAEREIYKPLRLGRRDVRCQIGQQGVVVLGYNVVTAKPVANAITVGIANPSSTF